MLCRNLHVVLRAGDNYHVEELREMIREVSADKDKTTSISWKDFAIAMSP